MKYNREEAIKYAIEFRKNTNTPKFKNYDIDGYEGTDCANFVSQCMYEGGGMPMKKEATRGSKYDVWYYDNAGRSSSWTGANSLRLFIKYNTVGYPRMNYTFLSESNLDKLEKGMWFLL